jgi:hypothetical protein
MQEIVAAGNPDRKKGVARFERSHSLMKELAILENQPWEVQGWHERMSCLRNRTVLVALSVSAQHFPNSNTRAAPRGVVVGGSY